MMTKNFSTPEFVGLIPAAGDASRIHSLPFSKALYPVLASSSELTVIETPIGRLLDSMKHAGAARAIIVSRAGRSDLVEHIQDGSRFGLPAAHVTVQPTPSVPHTLCAALPFLSGARVLLGLPDILFEPFNSLHAMMSSQLGSQADVVLGLLPSDQPEQCDMVEIDKRQEVVRIDVKTKSSAKHAWVFAAWRPVFSDFLVRYVAGSDNGDRDTKGRELQLADIFTAAQRDGLTVVGETVAQGRFLDIGTAQGLARIPSFVSGEAGD